MNDKQINNYFNTRFKIDNNRKKVWVKLTPYFQKFINKDSVILELGAGYCHFINNINGSRKIALDIAGTMKKYANNDIEFIAADWSAIKDFQNESVDVIFASNFLEHFNKMEGAEIVAECRRILNTGGKLILMQPNFYYSFRNYFDDYTHEAIYTHTSICDFLIANGYEIQLIKKRFLPFSMKGHSGSLHFLIPMYLRFPIKPFAKQLLVIATI